MGYASTIPSGISVSQTGTAAASFWALTNASVDYNLNTFKTLNYKQPLSYAFADLVIDGAKDTSGAENHLVTTWLGYVNLNDGASDKNAGLCSLWFWTPANGYIGQVRIRLTEDLASFLKPNTDYAASLKDIGCVGNNLVLYNPRVELSMYFGV